ncbi:MAG: RNA 3'-phosphate cyclase [Candidatus Omnitrophica bacterium]|nr:RNA 3'-phosphate cyclase [Candidatus Omnitrophota bacterium]MBU4479795.1 RNA 3'-phosphate cyclase [Candidatus Omnitrophota bacterium]
MMEIDGSLKSGSGTIVRYALSLASLIKKAVRIKNIRAKRKNPGLRPQHLKTVQACCDLTQGKAQNLKPGASEIMFSPGKKIRGGSFSWDIGTAGSTTMMALCVLPLALFSDKQSHYTISGGLFQDFAPNAFHVKCVLLHLLRRFSLQADLEMIRPGYVPSGAGIIKLRVTPITKKLLPLRLLEPGKVAFIKGVAISSHLEQKKVSERMKDACLSVLEKAGYKADIEIINDKSANQRGAALFIYAQTDTGCIIGADMAGKLGRPAEKIGGYVARSLLEDIDSGATVDRFTADQLILYAALADGESGYIIPRMSAHIDSNLWLVEKMLGAKVSLDGKRLLIKGVGLERS